MSPHQKRRSRKRDPGKILHRERENPDDRSGTEPKSNVKSSYTIHSRSCSHLHLRPSVFKFQKNLRGMMNVHPFNMGSIDDYPVSLSWSACVPDKCTAEEISGIFTDLFGNTTLLKGVSIGFSEELCQTFGEAHPELSAGAITTM